MADLKSKLIAQYNLEMEVDFYIDTEGKNVILKSGIMKVKHKLGASIDHEIVQVSANHEHCVIKTTGVARINDRKQRVVDFGEVSPKNNTYEYPIAVAKKRGEGRVIIDLAKFSEEGWLTEDELSTAIAPPTKIPPKEMVDNLEKKIEEKKSGGSKGLRARKIVKEEMPKDLPDNAIIIDKITHILEGEVDGRWIIYKVIDGKKEMTTCDDEETYNKLVDLLKKKAEPLPETSPIKKAKEPEPKKKSLPDNEVILIGDTKYALMGEQKDGKYLIAGKRGQSPIVEMYEGEAAYNDRVKILRESIDPEAPPAKKEEPKTEVEKIKVGDADYELWGKQKDGTWLIFGKKGKNPISARYETEEEYNEHVKRLRFGIKQVSDEKSSEPDTTIKPETIFPGSDHSGENMTEAKPETKEKTSEEESAEKADGVVETTISATEMDADKVTVPVEKPESETNEKISEEEKTLKTGERSEKEELEYNPEDQLNIDLSPLADLTNNVIKL